MGAEIITETDTVELERVLVTLERLGGTGERLAEVARKATAAILDVVDVLSPSEVDVAWDAEAA